jgi:GGDEF domain-containing protein
MSQPTPELIGACGYPANFVRLLEDVLAKKRGSGSAVGLMLVSIDNLMMIISGYGINVAEQVMVELRALIAAHFIVF